MDNKFNQVENDISEDEIFDGLSTILLGTNDSIRPGIVALGWAIGTLTAERILNKHGLFICAGCGIWAYTNDEYCEECEEDDPWG